MLSPICKRLRLHSHYYQITISSYFGKGQTHLFDFTILLREWKTLILIERIFFQPTWLQCKSPYKECRNSCGTSCGVAVELPAYSVKVKVDTTYQIKKANSKEFLSFIPLVLSCIYNDRRRLLRKTKIIRLKGA